MTTHREKDSGRTLRRKKKKKNNGAAVAQGRITDTCCSSCRNWDGDGRKCEKVWTFRGAWTRNVAATIHPLA